NYLSGNESFYKRALENRKEDSYSGIVIEKYIDSSQHRTPSGASVPLVNAKKISNIIINQRGKN
ncbi:MAG: hypothetical protein ABI892_09955, partial [Flavobacterium sp.]